MDCLKTTGILIFVILENLLENIYQNELHKLELDHSLYIVLVKAAERFIENVPDVISQERSAFL